MLTSLFVATLSMAAAAQGEADAPDRLFTSQGVEIRSDERVFVLFAALNGLGYSEETERKGPPLRAPVFHPIRLQVRDALRKLDEAGKLTSIRTVFDDNPAEIEVYLEAILASEAGEKNLSPQAKKIMPAIESLDAFRQKVGLAKLFDTIAIEQRTHAKELKTRIEKGLAAAGKMIGASDLRAPVSLVVVPNPLDGHDVVRKIATKDHTYVVPGPGFKEGERAALEAVLQSTMKKPVEAVWGSAGGVKYAKAWDTVKGSPRIAGRYGDAKAYLADTLAHVLAFKATTKLSGAAQKTQEEDFIEEMNRDGLRWGRTVLRALDGVEGGSEPFDAVLARGLARSAP